jgi:hypothetical protein
MKKSPLVLIWICSLALAGCAAPATTTPTAIPLPTATTAPTALPTDVPDEPTLPPAFPLTGRWEGKARNGDMEFEVKLDLSADCVVDGPCGSFEIPVVPCTGSYVLSEEKGGVYT